MVNVVETETGTEIETFKKEVIMPGGDRRGPDGNGPMTGRRMGLCVGNDEPGFDDGQRAGRGFGRGAGMGRGPGRRQGRGWGFGGRFRDRFFSDNVQTVGEVKQKKSKKKK